MTYSKRLKSYFDRNVKVPSWRSKTCKYVAVNPDKYGVGEAVYKCFKTKKEAFDYCKRAKINPRKYLMWGGEFGFGKEFKPDCGVRKVTKRRVVRYNTKKFTRGKAGELFLTRTPRTLFG